MVALRIDTFGGMIPAVSEELLPPSAAAFSKNTWLYDGTVRGLPVSKQTYQLLEPANTSKVYRLPESYGRSTYFPYSTWLEFSIADTDIIRAPVFGDTYDRYYFADGGGNPPKYNTRERIENGEHPFLLGIEPPSTAPTLAVDGGSIRLPDARVATVEAGTFSTDYEAGKVVDGITLVVDDLLLIKNQEGGLASANGLYVVRSGAPPVRADEMDTTDEFVGRYVKVLEGDANAGTFWKVTNTVPPIVGTTAIEFEEISTLPVEVTRSYVYTWLSEYKEESAPSPPVVVTGTQDGTWNLSGMDVLDVLDIGDDPSNGNNARRFITKKRIYRTITSINGVASFFLVDEIDADETTYADNKTDDEVSQNALLESFDWTPPPSDMKGLTVMWNGMVAGFRENELWICSPYRPHAWPAAHVLTMEYPIVGLGVANQTLVVCTAGNPVTVNGANPNNLTDAKIAKFEPCTSRGSILSSPNGVAYASPNGLVVCGQGGAINVTKDLISREKWEEYTKGSKLKAAWLGEAYFVYGSLTPGAFEPTAWATLENDPGLSDEWVSQYDASGATTGFLIDFNNQRIGFILADSETPVVNMYNDVWSGDVLIIRADPDTPENVWVERLDISDKNQPYQPGIWRSKVFQTPDKKNIGAMKVFFKDAPGLPTLNPVRNVDPDQVLADDQWGLCRVYADGRLILTRELRTSGELWKLPSGFKADFWQYEVETRLKILNIQAASTVKELMGV